MHFAVTFLFAVTLPAVSVFAQGHHSGGGAAAAGGFGGRGGGGNGAGAGGNSPSTFITSVTSAAPAATASSAATSSGGVASIDGSSCPAFGITAGVKATDGTANCVGDNGVDIPCDCPPNLNTFTSFLGTVVASGDQFPSGTSAADQLTRLQTCLVALQNFQGGLGSGVGCPIVSTNWKELQTQLQSEA
ncbi:hypothetical protein EDD36DRAFT_451511 [Exophiala viscosa]|uniref:Extracellular membrane protein CFEM domain-containing protein n=2 Tax=Exophiala viscosa TaxID=2486360 RepID=A0AAN6E287_9EURO|nr:hypothetical protein EDD36DRAFT_451511 [Exophiala viscosa]